MIHRREFITLLGGAVAAWPVGTNAQQGAIPIIGFVGASNATLASERVHVFPNGCVSWDGMKAEMSQSSIAGLRAIPNARRR
jgi:hypothetical protein